MVELGGTTVIKKQRVPSCRMAFVAHVLGTME